MGTASTMTSLAEALGMTLPGSANIPGARFAAHGDRRIERTRRGGNDRTRAESRRAF